mgnify:CR=1 FL=1
MENFLMKKPSGDLTQGSLWKNIFIFSIPLILSNILQVLFNMSDIAVVGRFAGPLALGSVGSTTILVTMFTGFLIGLSGGINVLTALYLGAGKKQALSHTVHSSLIVSIASGLLLLLFGVCFAHPVLELLKTKEELIDGSVLYLRIYFLGMPALAIYNCGNAIFSAAGDTARPLRYLLIAGILNVIMNLFFVIICHMDVAGVGAASALSQYVSAGLILRDLFRINTDYKLHLSRLRLDPSKTVDILKIGIPIRLSERYFCPCKPVRPGRCQLLQCYYGCRKFCCY